MKRHRNVLIYISRFCESMQWEKKSVTVELLIRSFMHIKCSEKENANKRDQCFYWLI
jgi:hypothetical protein